MLKLAIVMCSLIVSSTMFNAEAAGRVCHWPQRGEWTCPEDRPKCCFDQKALKGYCLPLTACCYLCIGEGGCSCH